MSDYVSKEAKAFIHQKLEDLKSLLTTEETAGVTLADARKQLKRMEKRGEDIESLKGSNCCLIITIKGHDQELKIEGFGKTHEEAMDNAHKVAYSLLSEIHDQTISTQDRNNLLEQYKTKGHIIH